MRRFALIALFFCALLSCKEEAVTPAAPPLASVSVENVFAIDMPIQLIFPGTTSSVQDVEVEARVQGWLTQRHFQQGQEVVKGDLLYEIDATSFDLQLMQSIAVMESAAVQSDYAQKEYDRNEPLIKTGAVSMQTFDQLESQLEEALAQLAQAEAGVALAELNVRLNFLASQLVLVEKTGAVSNNLVALYKALGGDWEKERQIEVTQIRNEQ